MTNVEKWGVYLHIPYCASKCSYCSFVSDCDFSDEEAYIRALEDEIRERGCFRKADTVYIGGGTPSVLSRGRLSSLLNCVRENFDLSTDAEITAECNPDSADEGFFDECAKSGVNRISIGLQSACDRLLKAVNRRHNAEQFSSAVKTAKKCGDFDLSADMMLGLPTQSEDDAERTLDLLLSSELAHISVYGLSVEEGTPLFESGYRPDEDFCAALYDLCAERLKASGYLRYEVSNFALKGKRCRHNMKYWTGAPYIGLGAAAHSYDGEYRYENTSDRKEYIRGNRSKQKIRLTKEDKAEERIMLSLRISDGLDLNAFERDFGFDLVKAKKEQIKKLTRAGLVGVTKNRLTLTEKAYYVMNSVILSLI